MKHNVMLTIASLLSILFMTFHLTDDIVHGMEPGGLTNLIALVVILAIWLYGALVLAGRRSGYVIILLGSVLGAGIPSSTCGGRESAASSPSPAEPSSSSGHSSRSA